MRTSTQARRLPGAPAALALAWALGGCGLDAIVHEIDPPCECSNPGDVCRDSTCSQPETSCTAVSGCEAPYLCNTDRGRCTCDPTPQAWDQCAPRCDGENECPEDTDCDETTDTCLPPVQCISDAICAPAEACLRQQPYESVIWDGNDGYFISGSIGRACLTGGRSSNGCNTASDCEQGDCVIDGDGFGVCTETSICAGSEFRFGTGAPNCYLHQACRHDEECPDAYDCLLVVLESSGYCGRPA